MTNNKSRQRLIPNTTIQQHRIAIGTNKYKYIQQQYTDKNTTTTTTFLLTTTLIILTLTTLLTNTIIYNNNCHPSITNKYNNQIQQLTFDNNDQQILTTNTYNKYLQQQHNKSQHCTLGNKNTGLKLAHWNKGNSHFTTKLHEIKHILDRHKPQILSLSEANIKHDIDHQTYQLHNYNIETALMAHDTGIARTAILIDNNLNYTRRHDLEDKNTSTVWLEVKIPNTKSILFMSGYRQWQLPKNHSNYNTESHTVPQQYKRLDNILTKWTTALQQHKNTIVMMDDNIDTLPNNIHNNKYKIQTLKNRLMTYLQTNNLANHIHLPTRHSSNTTPSCIDHIYTNCPTQIHNTQIHNTGASDHCLLTTTYTTKHTTLQPTHIYKRKYHLLTQHTLEQYIQNSQPLTDIFQLTDPDLIANTLSTELNNIIDIIAPKYKIQTKTTHAPYIDKHLLQQIQQRQSYHNTACQTNLPEDWRQYRHYRNYLNRQLNNKKTEYYTNKFNKIDTNTNTDNNTNNNTDNPKQNNKMWRTLQTLTKTNKQQTPKQIIHDNKLVTSPKLLANIANKHYIDKIQHIRDNLTKYTLDPINILKILIPRTTQTLTIPPITLQQTIDLITKSDNSNSTGHDSITMTTLKKIKHTIAPHLTHLINTILHTNTYPQTFKHSRITPINKPKKPLTNIDSFRPINNLTTLSKLVDQHIKQHLDKHLTDNNIIHDNHHGGRQKHSTTTALTQILNTLHTNKEQGYITATLQTDLSAAFDTVDTKILLDKLQHYGIRDNTLTLLTSYMTNRTQHVQIDTFDSTTLPSLQCSVVQGSKLSGTLYTLYTNEIPLLHKLMNTKHYDYVTLKPHTIHDNITHTTINFVDDSTNLVSSNNHDKLTNYLTDFYTLLHSYYTINKLKINADKTELLITCKQHLKTQADMVTMTALNYTIQQKQTTKILGYILNNKLTHNDFLNTKKQTINNRIHTLNTLNKYMTQHTKQLIAHATVLSTFNYLLPLIIDTSTDNLTLLQTLQLKTARIVLGSPCYRWSTAKILTSIKWQSIYHMITCSSLIQMHKIISDTVPHSLYTLLTSTMHTQNTRRHTRKVHMKYTPLTDKLHNTYMYKALSIYNSLPSTLTTLNTKQFKTNIKKHITLHYRPDRLPDRVT